MMKLYFITLGCKTNQAETQGMQAILAQRGHSIVSAYDYADVIVINTCAVTAESVRKSKAAVRMAKSKYPGAKIAA